MSDPEARRFARTLTIVLVLLAALTAGSVLLFGHLLFKSLSKDVYDQAIFQSRLDAERLAKSLAEKSANDEYILRLKEKEIAGYVEATLAERRVLTEVRVEDKHGKVLYQYNSVLLRPDTRPVGTEGGGAPQPVMPSEQSQETTLSIANPYDIEVPVGDFGVLRVGVSRKELEARVEKLRTQLYQRTFAAALVSLLGILLASVAIVLLVRKTRRVEAARAEAERRAELGEVAAGLAHEIRNPLNAMSLNLELLEEELQKAHQQGARSTGLTEELALSARQETTRLARLLTDFLSYARPSPITPALADLNEPAQEAVSFLLPEAQKRGIRLAFTPHPGGAPARLDAARVKQVVLNLVGNALDASEAEGARRREVHVAVEEDGDFWRLTVSDHGPGVPEAGRGDLFKVFVSTKPAGTGLGLPIAERIVKGHGGSLSLSSEPGEPTRAVATFPRAA